VRERDGRAFLLQTYEIRVLPREMDPIQELQTIIISILVFDWCQSQSRQFIGFVGDPHFQEQFAHSTIPHSTAQI
jgi:hypothetical protein